MKYELVVLSLCFLMLMLPVLMLDNVYEISTEKNHSNYSCSGIYFADFLYTAIAYSDRYSGAIAAIAFCPAYR